MITVAGLSTLLLPDFKRVYFETGKERPAEYTLFLNVEDLDWQGEKDLQISGLSTMPAKAEGSQFALDAPILGGQKQYTANPYGLAVEISWEMWRDDLYGVMKELIGSIARAGRNKQEVQAHSVMNNAFSTSFVGFTAAESLCQTSHALLNGATADNRPTTDIGVSVTYLQGAITRYENMVDERGLPRLMAPRMYLYGPSNRFVGREILGSSHKPFSANNEINSLVQDDLSVMVDHYLTTSTYHFLLAAQGEHDLNFRWRDHALFDMFDDPRTKTAVATGYQRHTDGVFGAWQGVDGSTG